MRTEIAFRPMTFEAAGIVPAFYEELSNIIIAVPAHGTIGEGQCEVHSMPIAWAVVVKAGPRTGRKEIIGHGRQLK
jgi:hypothetical protein